MKEFTLLMCILTSFFVAAQSNYYSVYHDNSANGQVHLGVLPWDNSKLIQVYRDIDSVSFEVTYKMEYGLNGLPIGVPGCGVMTGKPEFLENGILVAGTSFNQGVELHYFDGTTATTFDINSGAGDSNPVIQVLNGKVIVIGDNGNGARNIFSFDEAALSLEQRSFETQTNEMVALIDFGNEIYVNHELYNYTSGVVTFQLAKYDGNGNKTVLKNSSAPIGAGEFWKWYNPIEKWGEIFFVESYVQGNSGPHQIRVLPFVTTNEYSTLDYYLPNSGPAAHAVLFEDDSKLYGYLHGTDSLFSIEQHLQGTPVQMYQLEHQFSEGVITEHHIAENQNLYFKLIENPSDIHKVVRLNAGTESLLIEDDHFHFTLEENGVVYVQRYDQSWIGTNEPSAVHLLNTAFDGVDKVELELGLHGPFVDASVIFDGKYTFFFMECDGSADIFQLESSPSASLDELSPILNVYPNPISNGNELHLEVGYDTPFEIVNASGAIIQSGELVSGANIVQIELVSEGVYFLKAGITAHRIIVID